MGLSVVLVNPPTRITSKDFPYGDKFICENLGLGYIASKIRSSDKHRVEILDCFIEARPIDELVSEIRAINPDVVGFSITFHPSEEFLGPIVEGLQSPDLQIFLGGNHATFSARRLLNKFPLVDGVVMGEGEKVFLELLEHIESGRDYQDLPGVSCRRSDGSIVLKRQNATERLDSLPFPSRDTLPKVLEGGGTAYISTSRGCYARCKFCTVNKFEDVKKIPRWRQRSPENVVSEIADLNERFGVTSFFFVDDNFIGPGAKGKRDVVIFAEHLANMEFDVRFSIQTRSNDLNEDVIEALKNAGLRVVFLGIESGSQDSLDFYQKDCVIEENYRAIRILNSYDVGGIYGLIMFNPQTTWSSFWESITFLREVKDYNLSWVSSRLRDLPGSSFHSSLSSSEANTGRDGFRYYEIENPEIRDLQRLLENVTRRLDAGYSAWEQFKWASYMSAEETKLGEAKERLASFQNQAIQLISGLAQDFQSNSSKMPISYFDQYWSPLFENLGASMEQDFTDRV